MDGGEGDGFAVLVLRRFVVGIHTGKKGKLAEELHGITEVFGKVAELFEILEALFEVFKLHFHVV